MKIVAEFNSIQEIREFAELIGKKEITLKADYIKPEIVQEVIKVDAVQEVAPEKEETKVIENKEIIEEVVKEEVIKEEVQEVVPETEKAKSLSKEDIREIFSSLIKAGKQKEAKELTNSYGAKRIPDLKEEHYSEVYAKAEKLLKGESIDE